MKLIEASLDELGSVSRGRSRHRPRDAEHLYGGPYPFVQTGDIKRAHLYLHEYTQTYSDAGLAQSKMWPRGTLCITIAANIADTAILGIDACFPDSVIGFIANEQRSDARFIKYLIDTIKSQYQQVSRGATQDNLSQQKLLSFKLRVPEVGIQQRIAGILATYDEMIVNNTRRIKLLEDAAKLLYEEWFVRLRFPGHEHTPVRNGVPEGWSKRPLDHLASIVMGQSPKSTYYNDVGDGLPFHQGVTDFGSRFPTHRIFCTVQNRLAEPGDILFSVRAPVGRINIAPERLIVGRGLSAIRSKRNAQNWLFYALKSHFFKEDLIGGGAIFAAITKKDLYQVPLLCPTDRLVTQFVEFTVPLDRQIEVLQRATTQLQQARDLLLPRLISGEVAV